MGPSQIVQASHQLHERSYSDLLFTVNLPITVSEKLCVDVKSVATVHYNTLGATGGLL